MTGDERRAAVRLRTQEARWLEEARARLQIAGRRRRPAARPSSTREENR